MLTEITFSGDRYHSKHIAPSGSAAICGGSTSEGRDSRKIMAFRRTSFEIGLALSPSQFSDEHSSKIFSQFPGDVFIREIGHVVGVPLRFFRRVRGKKLVFCPRTGPSMSRRFFRFPMIGPFFQVLDHIPDVLAKPRFGFAM